MRWLKLIGACTILASLSCLSVSDAKNWASEVSMQADVSNPKLTMFYGCGVIVSVDGVEGSGTMHKDATGPATRPAE